MHINGLSIAVYGYRKYNQSSKITNFSSNKAHIPSPLKSLLAILGELKSNAEIDQNPDFTASYILPETHHGGNSSPYCMQEVSKRKGRGRVYVGGGDAISLQRPQ